MRASKFLGVVCAGFIALSLSAPHAGATTSKSSDRPNRADWSNVEAKDGHDSYGSLDKMSFGYLSFLPWGDHRSGDDNKGNDNRGNDNKGNDNRDRNKGDQGNYGNNNDCGCAHQVQPLSEDRGDYRNSDQSAWSSWSSSDVKSSYCADQGRGDSGDRGSDGYGSDNRGSKDGSSYGSHDKGSDNSRWSGYDGGPQSTLTGLGADADSLLGV